MDRLKLEYEIKKAGLSIKDLCQRIGISPAAYYRKCNGKSEFTLSEIQAICKELGLDSPMGIFFADMVS